MPISGEESEKSSRAAFRSGFVFSQADSWSQGRGRGRGERKQDHANTAATYGKIRVIVGKALAADEALKMRPYECFVATVS